MEQLWELKKKNFAKIEHLSCQNVSFILKLYNFLPFCRKIMKARKQSGVFSSSDSLNFQDWQSYHLAVLLKNWNFIIFLTYRLFDYPMFVWANLKMCFVELLQRCRFQIYVLYFSRLFHFPLLYFCANQRVRQIHFHLGTLIITFQLRFKIILR